MCVHVCTNMLDSLKHHPQLRNIGSGAELGVDILLSCCQRASVVLQTLHLVATSYNKLEPLIDFPFHEAFSLVLNFFPCIPSIAYEIQNAERFKIFLYTIF